MPHTFQSDLLLRFVARVFKIFCLKHAQNRRQFFVSKGLVPFNLCTLAYKHLCVGRNLYTRHFGNRMRALSHNGRIHLSVFYNHIADLRFFGGIQNVRAAL